MADPGDRRAARLAELQQRILQAQQARTSVLLAVTSGAGGSGDAVATTPAAAPAAAPATAASERRPTPERLGLGSRSNGAGPPAPQPEAKRARGDVDADVSFDELLATPTVKERKEREQQGELLDILMSKTAKERSILEKFKSKVDTFQEFCQYGTRENCEEGNPDARDCRKVHFRKIIQPHTNERLGVCPYLNGCHRMSTCKMLHYKVERTAARPPPAATALAEAIRPQHPCQWINMDVRAIIPSAFGTFGVLMADPPWMISQKLPYGTMTDEEMLALPMGDLVQDGFIFLWVTGRALELGRECMARWGFRRTDELVWIKTNQVQRLIRTGRTGHWLNHSKEHCLVGVKGSPAGANRGLDCDVIVSEVRETSQKPDEIYGIIERLSPGTRKIEIFGRPNNTREGWLTIGNQLPGMQLADPELVERLNKAYPDLRATVTENPLPNAPVDVKTLRV